MRKSSARVVVLLLIVMGLLGCGSSGGGDTWTIRTNEQGGNSTYIFEAKAGGNYNGETTSGCELCCRGVVDSWTVSSSGDLTVTFHCDIASGTLTGTMSGDTVSGDASCTQNNWAGTFTGSKN